MVSSKIRAAGRGRPRGFDEEEALDNAMLAFWRGGYGQTSLDDLVLATGASRASLYRVFGDKRAIFEKALAHYGSRFAERITDALDSPMTGRERLAAVLNASADRLVSPEAPPGCLRCNSTLELMGTDPTMDAVLTEANECFVRSLARLIERAAEDGEVSKNAASSLAVYYTAIVNGMVTLARSGASREDLRHVIETSLKAWPDGRTE